MQQILFIHGDNTHNVQTLLNEGWKIISVTPVSQHTTVSAGGGYSSYQKEKGTFGAYVVLEKI